MHKSVGGLVGGSVGGLVGGSVGGSVDGSVVSFIFLLFVYLSIHLMNIQNFKKSILVKIPHAASKRSML